LNTARIKGKAFHSSPRSLKYGKRRFKNDNSDFSLALSTSLFSDAHIDKDHYITSICKVLHKSPKFIVYSTNVYGVFVCIRYILDFRELVLKRTRSRLLQSLDFNEENKLDVSEW
jgi:D-alanyl-lipoteichoic acid acyltransferase DltB (MBOAT superfamily)